MCIAYPIFRWYKCAITVVESRSMIDKTFWVDRINKEEDNELAIDA